MRFYRVLGWVAASLALTACAQNSHHLNTTFLDRYAESNPTLASFTECSGFSCAEASRVSLSPAAWRRVAAKLRPAAKDARTERRLISQAVAEMRMLVGAQTGTAVHQWTHKDMIILPNLGDRTQLDCIDESVNTWTYMTLMERAGLFRFHKVAKLSNAGSLHDPRNTAVLQENGGGYFAVDSSLVDAGVPPPVISLAAWLGSWPPDLSTSDSPPARADRRVRAVSNDSKRTPAAAPRPN